MSLYLAYGICLDTNVPIPGLVELTTQKESTSTVKIKLGFLPAALHSSIQDAVTDSKQCLSLNIDHQGLPDLRIWLIDQAKYFYFRYGDETEFIIDAQATQVWAAWPPDLTLEDTVTYLLGSILGLVLRLRGTVCLHASAVIVDGKAAVFMGESGAGKSTLVAAFAQQGYTVLSDDIVALVDQGNSFLVQPAYPRIRLWEPSVQALYGKQDALPRIVPTHPTWNKRFLDLTQPGYRFTQEPLPLGAIYDISARMPELSYPCIEGLSAREQLLALIDNTYIKSLISKSLRAKEFDLLSRLVKAVPICQLVPHADIVRLPQMLEMILENFSVISSNQFVVANA